MLAAKLMGRWRSGAPLVLAPEKDDPVIADDPQRNNNFNYAKMEPQGYGVPLGSHIRTLSTDCSRASVSAMESLPAHWIC